MVAKIEKCIRLEPSNGRYVILNTIALENYVFIIKTVTILLFRAKRYYLGNK